MQLSESDLILNNGRLYHIDLKPGELAKTIILVGDPERVPEVSKHFDRVEFTRVKREFITHTGYIGPLPISVMSTGMGACNIDIALNEIDALFNIDLSTRQIKNTHTQCRIIRLGTCGGLKKTTPLDSLVLSSYGFAFDGCFNYYQHQYNENEKALMQQIQQVFAGMPALDGAYVGQSGSHLISALLAHCHHGMTFTCSGFYGAQQRYVRAPLIKQSLFDVAEQLEFNGQRVLNLEMETAAIYALGRLLNHECYSVSCVVANREAQAYSKNAHQAVEKMITTILELL